MAGIKYIAPLFDGSGYAEAARSYALAIHEQGYPITLAPISFEQTKPDLGKDGEVLRGLINKQIDYDKVIVHSTPDLWTRLVAQETNKYIIGYTVWETSALHPSWIPPCNQQANEIWVPSEWNVEVFRNSGVQRPIYKIPHPVSAPDLATVSNFEFSGLSDDLYVFYSIFQWQERKNPYELLSAYCAAFSETEDVVLVLKTYMQDQAGDKEKIRQVLSEFRKFINLPKFPKIYLVVENMSKERIWGLHKRGDCLLLLQHSEGWGLVHAEAAACGNPIITTGYGGQTEFLNRNNSYLIDYNLSPVLGMTWSPYYTAKQYWASPNLKQAIETMRHVYENPDEAKWKGLNAQQTMVGIFSRAKVGRLVVDRLQEIDRK